MFSWKSFFLRHRFTIVRSFWFLTRFICDMINFPRNSLKTFLVIYFHCFCTKTVAYRLFSLVFKIIFMIFFRQHNSIILTLFCETFSRNAKLIFHVNLFSEKLKCKLNYSSSQKSSESNLKFVQFFKSFKLK